MRPSVSSSATPPPVRGGGTTVGGYLPVTDVYGLRGVAGHYVCRG